MVGNHGCFCTITAELSCCNRGCMAHRAKHIYYLALYRKSMPTPDLAYHLGAWSLESCCLQLCDRSWKTYLNRLSSFYLHHHYPIPSQRSVFLGLLQSPGWQESTSTFSRWSSIPSLEVRIIFWPPIPFTCQTICTHTHIHTPQIFKLKILKWISIILLR